MNKEFDSDGKRVKDIYPLNDTKLFEILEKINSIKRGVHAMFLREEGIGICGHIISEYVSMSCDIGRLIEGSHIDKEPLRLYLQTFEYEGLQLGETKPNLVDLLREYII